MRFMRRSSGASRRCRSIRVNGTDVPYRVVRRGGKYPRLEFKTGGLLAVLPKSWKDEAPLLEKKIEWISRKYEEIQRALDGFKALGGNGRDLLVFGNFFRIRENGAVKIDFGGTTVECNLKERRQVKRLRTILKERLLSEVELAALEYSQKFGVNFNRIFIRKQRTKWASCSAKGNLSFNFLLACLPKDLIRYIVCHEVLHLKRKSHDGNFWEQIGREFENYREMEKRLFEYWFLVQEYSRLSPLKNIVK